MSMYSGGGLLRVEVRSGVFDASTEAVSPDYFDIAGARPSAGRFFSESDDAVAVISEDFRRRLFGDGPGIGEAIKVNAVPATVIRVSLATALAASWLPARRASRVAPVEALREE